MNACIALYGWGVACLKKHTEMLCDLAARLELPAEAVAGAVKMTVTAGKRVLIENHRGILEFDTERIIIRTERGKLILSGTALAIRCMDGRDLLISGNLQHAEWE